MGIGQHKITVHGLPIRPSFSQKLPSKRQLRQQLGMDLQKPAVLLVGMITTPNSAAQHFMTASVFQSRALLALHCVVLHRRQWQDGLRSVTVLSPAVTQSTTKSCCHCVKHCSTCAAHRINIAASLMTSLAQHHLAYDHFAHLNRAYHMSSCIAGSNFRCSSRTYQFANCLVQHILSKLNIGGGCKQHCQQPIWVVSHTALCII